MTARGCGVKNDMMRTVYSSDTDDCILWPFSLDRDGYAGVVQTDNVKRKAYLLACTFRNGPKPSAQYQAAHSCGQCSCVNPRHLRWATSLENIHEKWAHGTMNWGERQGHHKLTETQVKEIRRLVCDGVPKQDIANQFGVCPSNVTQIVQRKTWKHV